MNWDKILIRIGFITIILVFLSLGIQIWRDRTPYEVKSELSERISDIKYHINNLENSANNLQSEFEYYRNLEQWEYEKYGEDYGSL